MKKQSIIRYSILLFFLVLFSIFSWRHFILGGGVAASVDALCPFGGFETLFTFIATGGFVPRILMSSLILGIGVLITVLIFKKGFCGYICPFGTVQELLGKITKRKIQVPEKVDKYERHIKYLVLAVILIGTAYTGSLVFRGYDPFMTFFHFGKGIFWDYSVDEFAEHIVPFGIMILTLGSSIFINRFWCKYLCPLGAVMNIFAKIGLTKISRNKKTCIDCKICDKKCPMNVKVSTVKSIKDVECINCNACVSNCPKKSLSIKTFNKKYSPIAYAILTIFTFFLIIFAAKAAGIWQSVPNMGDYSEEGDKISGDQLKGWMTLNQVSKSSGIQVKTIIKGVGFKDSNIDGDTAMKDISSKYGIEFETELVREFIDNYDPQKDHEVYTDVEITEDMSLLDVSSATGICLGHLAVDLKLPTNFDATVPMRIISEKYGISMNDVREVLANFQHDTATEKIVEQQIDETYGYEVDCPWNLKNDPYPGKCGLYIDTDNNKICDLSE